MPSIEERIEGGMLGLLIGDALGVPYEFKLPKELPARGLIEMVPPAEFERSHEGIAPGTWSDDGAHALCLLASLLDCGRFDVGDFAQRLIDWYERGYLAVGGEAFDVGVQTGEALRAISGGVPPLEAGMATPSGNGNGSLMRVLPLALWHPGSDAELVADARLSSRITHGHLRSQLCCALYCLWIRELLHGEVGPWEKATTSLRHVLDGDPEALAELEFHIRPEDEPEGKGSGYVVDTLRSARMVMSESSYEAVVRSAISLGHDTDTTAAVAGGAAGVRDGVGAIPERWLSALRGKELALPLIDRLHSR